MKALLLIRTTSVDDASDRLKKSLQSYFSNDIKYLIDDYKNESGQALEVDDCSVKVGRKFLIENSFPFFPRVGWQCGDFMLYAGAEAFPDYDFYWLIEPDVSFCLDINTFFEEAEDYHSDFLGSYFGKKPVRWGWHDSISHLVDGNVYGSDFPISRLSARAISHLKSERSSYSQENFINPLDKNYKYANDEAFVSSILVRDGFACGALNKIFPAQFDGYFHPVFPVLEDEISNLENKIVHPVCNKIRVKQKLKSIIRSKANYKRLEDRMKTMASCIGDEKWEEIFGFKVWELSDFYHGRRTFNI